MENKPRIVGVGHCCQDSICVVERYPQEDGSSHILSIDDSQGGGAVATALVAAARLGTDTAVIANLGDDPVAEKIRGGFQGYGVDTSCVTAIAGGRSSSSIVMVDAEKGTRTKFPYRDNLPPITWTAEKRQLIAESAVLHLDGTNFPNALAAAEIARENGTLVSLDGCSRQADNRLNLQLAELADILIMNAVYPFAVSGKSEIADALAYMASLGEKRLVMMTAGKDGSYAWLDGQVVHFPAFQVKAVDTTGAGDVFHGAFLSEWLRTEDIRRSIRFASAVSALKCRKPGGRSGIPTREEAEAFLASSI